MAAIQQSETMSACLNAIKIFLQKNTLDLQKTFQKRENIQEQKCLVDTRGHRRMVRIL